LKAIYPWKLRLASALKDADLQMYSETVQSVCTNGGAASDSHIDLLDKFDIGKLACHSHDRANKLIETVCGRWVGQLMEISTKLNGCCPQWRPHADDLAKEPLTDMAKTLVTNPKYEEMAQLANVLNRRLLIIRSVKYNQQDRSIVVQEDFDKLSDVATFGLLTDMASCCQ
jgi:hypothetical protein